MLLFTSMLYGQSDINFKVTTLGLHLNNATNAALYKNSIGSDGLLVFEPGIMLAYEPFLSGDYFAAKITQVLFMDGAGKLSGSTQLGLRHRLFMSYKHSLNAGLSTGIHYRQDWSGIDGYCNDHFSNWNGWQYKFVYIGGEIEYNYSISKNFDWSVSLNYYQPYTINLTTGFRYWISKKIKSGKKCISCPDFN